MRAMAHWPMPERTYNADSTISFASILEEKRRSAIAAQFTGDVSQTIKPSSSTNLDDLVKKIDAKIAELEAEEAAEKVVKQKNETEADTSAEQQPLNPEIPISTIESEVFES